MSKIDYRELAHVLTTPRQTGVTTAMCRQAISLDATLIVHNYSEVVRLNVAHGVKTVTLNHLERLMGLGKPVLIDHNALAIVIHRMQDEIDELKEKSELADKLKFRLKEVLGE